VGGLEPVVGAARARNVSVEVQVVGDPGCPGEDVVRATVAAVDCILRAIPPQPVVLTVLVSGVAAELFLTFERAPDGDVAGLARDVAGLGRGGCAAAGWRAMLEVEDTGPGCLEVHWRRAVPA